MMSNEGLVNWLFAIVVTTVFFLSLIILFAPVRLYKRSYKRSSKGKIFLVMVSSDSKNRLSKNIAYWLRVEDPILMTEPNSIVGYKRLFLNNYFKFIKNYELNIDRGFHKNILRKSNTHTYNEYFNSMLKYYFRKQLNRIELQTFYNYR